MMGRALPVDELLFVAAGYRPPDPFDLRLIVFLDRVR
jgi:hypothetical protein